MKRSMRFLFPLALSLILSHSVEAAVSCLYIHSRQSAAEVEIGNTPIVMELFTTTDGSIAPVLSSKGIEALHPEVRESLEQAFPGENITGLSWDLLNHKEKTMVIEYSAKMNGHEFFKNRTIPGLKYIDTVTLTFTEPTTFLGRPWSKGKHQVSTKDIFANTAIEFMGPNRMTENLGFELHVRSSNPAEQNYQTARSLQKALTGQHIAMHLHIVAPVTKTPSIRLKLEEVLQRVEFHRRVSLLFEMKMISRGVGMKRVPVQDAEGRETNASNFFDFSPAEAIDGGVKFFRGFNWEQTSTFMERMRIRITGQELPQTDRLYSKSGTVGVRGSQAYDSKDQPLWGIEIRYLSPFTDGKQDAKDIAAVQRRMIDETFTMTEAEAADYIGNFQKKHNSLDVVDHLWYVDAVGTKMDRAALSTLVKRFPELKNKTTAEMTVILKKFEDNSFLYMLTHDWSKDPMFYNQTTKLAQMVDAQNVALHWIVTTNANPTDVMKTFIKKSGLEYTIRSSFGTFDN